MADNLTRILKIGIDESIIKDAKYKVHQLGIEIKALSKTQKEQKGTVLENTIAYKLNAAELKALQKEERQNMEILKQANTIVRSQVGSNNEKAATLSILRAKYDMLSKAEQDNVETGGKLQKHIKELSDEYKANKDQLGQNYLNVGNYEGALKGLKQQLKDAKDEMIAAAAANGVQSAEFQAAATKAGALKDQIDDVNTATKELASGSNLGQFKTTLSGVGQSLKELDFAEAAEKAGRLATIAKAMTFSEMLGGLKNLGSALFNLTKSLVTNPFFALAAAVTATVLVLKDLYDTNQNIIKSQGEVDKSIAESKGFLKDYADKVEDAYLRIQVATGAKTQAEADAIKATRDTNALILAEQKKHNEDIKKLKEDLGFIESFASATALQKLTYNAKKQEGIKAAFNSQSEQLEKEHLKRIDAINQAAAAEATAAKIEALVNEKAEIQKEIDDTLADTEKFNAETIAINKNAAEEIADLKLKEIEAEDKAEAEAEQKEAEAEAAKLKIREDFAEERALARLDEFEKEKFLLDKRVNDLRLAGVDEVAIAQFIADERNRINKEADMADTKARLKKIDDEAAIAKAQIQLLDLSEKERTDLIRAADQERLAAKIQAIQLEMDAFTASTEMTVGFDQEKNDALLLMKSELVEQLRQLDDTITTNQQASVEKIKEQTMGAVTGTIGVASDLIAGLQQAAQNNIKAITDQAKAAGKTDEEIQKLTLAARKRAKNLAIAAAIIQTFQAAIAAYSSGSAVPIVGVALGPIAAAAAIGFGLAQVSQIQSTPLGKGGIANRKKAARGAKFGVFGGRSHAHGGNKYYGEDGSVIETEKDELWVVVNKRSTGMLQNLSNINQAGGGVSFAQRGGIINKMAEGGFANGNLSGLFDDLSSPGRMADKLNAMQPVLVLEELQSVEGRQVRTEQRLSL